jgi:Bacterial Ig-like domain
MHTSQRLKIKLGSLLFIFLIPLLMAASCGEQKPPTPNSDDKTPPTIVSLTPKDKSSSVDLSAPAIVVFSEAIKKDSLTDSSVSLTGKGGVVIEKTLTLSEDKKTLTIAYKNLAKNPGTVTITLATTITDEAGNALAATTWSYTTPTWLSLSDALDVDKKNFTFEPTIATDKDGNIVIAWYEQDIVTSQNHIYVKRWNGSAWEQLGGALNTAVDSSADYSSLAIDSQNRPVLAWHEFSATSSIIALKIWTGTTWEQVGGGHGGATVTVDDGEFPSLAVKPDDTPVVAYAKNGDVFVRLWDGSSWVTWDAAGALDDVATHIASKPSLVLVPDGDMPNLIVPFVAFQENDTFSNNIYVKHYDATAFAWKDIDDANDELDIAVAREATNPSLSLAIDVPMVAWEEDNGTDRDIHVKQLDFMARAWKDVGKDDFAGQDSSEPFLVAAARFGTMPFSPPLLVWRANDAVTGDNVYIKTFDFSSNTWTTPTTPIESVNTPGQGSENPVVTIDKNYAPIVAFAEFDEATKSQNLHVKRLNQALWTIEVVK